MASSSVLCVVLVYVFAVQISATTDHGQSLPKEMGCCGHCALPGRDGRNGRDGIQGPYGPPGAPGENGPPGQSFFMESSLEKIVNILTEKMAVMIAKEVKLTRPVAHEDEEMTAEGRARSGSSFRENTQQAGAVYTRWGRKECPIYSTTLYRGVMAGSHYLHKGSGANHLCLPLNPQWNKTFEGRQSKAYLCGSEFELSITNPVFQQTNSGGAFFHDRDIQCAVCHTPGRPSHVMIPARLECPTGWTVEYVGFLMAAHHTHRKSEYVCVDQDPDTHTATSANVNGNLLYVVEAVCDSLPCPNYVDGYEVTCVVCTK